MTASEKEGVGIPRIRILFGMDPRDTKRDVVVRFASEQSQKETQKERDNPVAPVSVGYGQMGGAIPPLRSRLPTDRKHAFHVCNAGSIPADSAREETS